MSITRFATLDDTLNVPASQLGNVPGGGGGFGGGSILSLSSFNGSSDATRINALLAQLSGAPGVIFLPAGGNTFGVLDEPVFLDNGQYLFSFDPFACILKAAPGLNAHMIQSVNFATLTGTDTTAAPASLGLWGVGIDGNKANNSSGRGVALYASNVRLQNFFIRNCAGVPLWTEWGSTSAAVAGSESMENFISNFKLHDSNGEIGVSSHGVTCNPAGWCFLGSHDSQVNDGVIFNCGQDSSGTHHGMASLEIPAANFGNGATFDNIHIFGGTYDYGVRNAGGGITFGPRMQIEGARIAQTYVNGGSSTRLNGKFFSGGVSTATTVGLKMDSGASAASGTIKVENCGGGVMDWTGAGGDHNLKIHGTHTTQAPHSPAVIGSTPGNCQLEVIVTDTSGSKTNDTAATFLGRVSSNGGATLLPRDYYANGGNNFRRSIPRNGLPIADVNPLVSGELYVVGLELLEGDVVTNLTFKSHTTAMVTPADWWFALLDPSFNYLQFTANQLAAAWAAFTAKTLALAAAYTIPAGAGGLYYAGIMVNAATPPTLDGVSGSANSTAAGAYVAGEKVLAGIDSTHTGLTTTASAPAQATVTASGITVMAVTS